MTNISPRWNSAPLVKHAGSLRRGRLTQAASTRRLFGKWAQLFFFFNCQTFSYELNAPKPNYTADTAYQVPVLGKESLDSSVWILLLQAEHTFLISIFCNSNIPPWEKFLSLLHSINSSTEKE